MTRTDLRHHSIALLIPLCFASAAAATSGHPRIAYAIDAAMAFVLADWIVTDLGRSWTRRRSATSTALLTAACCIMGYGVVTIMA